MSEQEDWLMKWPGRLRRKRLIDEIVRHLLRHPEDSVEEIIVALSGEDPQFVRDTTHCMKNQWELIKTPWQVDVDQLVDAGKLSRWMVHLKVTGLRDGEYHFDLAARLLRTCPSGRELRQNVWITDAYAVMGSHYDLVLFVLATSTQQLSHFVIQELRDIDDITITDSLTTALIKK